MDMRQGAFHRMEEACLTHALFLRVGLVSFDKHLATHFDIFSMVCFSSVYS